MAQRRMFSKQIIDTDAFMDMPHSSQLLYFHLALRADDDGFVGSPKKIMRMIGSQDDDLKVLVTKRFILPFESGVCVIKHWRIHNYIQKDRYTETKYLEEKDKLGVKENGSYTECIQDVSIMEPQVREGNVSIGKDSKEEKRSFGESGLVKLTDEEYQKLSDLLGEQNTNLLIEEMDDYLGSKGKRYKSHYKALRTWARRRVTEEVSKPKRRIV